MTPILKWTGHPLADVGVATLCAMVGKRDPEDLTLEDLDECGSELGDCYVDSIFMSYLTCVFPNSAYVNPTMGIDTRNTAMKRLLFPHRASSDEGVKGLCCAFSGAPATHLLDRSQIPMLTGAGILNFFPAGTSELPVDAPYLLAIQALPLGCRRTEGKMMLVHCDDPTWTLRFANNYLKRNRILINLAKTNQLPQTDGALLERECSGWDKTKKRSKFPDAKAPQSLIMDDLAEVIDTHASGLMGNQSVSVTVYILSNSGQGPSLAIEHIPSQFVAFLRELRTYHYINNWKALVRRSWAVAKGADNSGDKPKGKSKKTAPAQPSSTRTVDRGPGLSRNEMYSDLFGIFSSGYCDWFAAAAFIRRHLLCNPMRYFSSSAQSPNLPPKIDRADIELIDWSLTCFFLQRVLGMNSQKTELIRDFADQLADLIVKHNDAPLFKSLVYTSSEWKYRGILTRVQRQYASDRKRMLLTFDQYVDLFLATDAGERAPWSLIRDLISIRLVEQLFKQGFFDRGGNSDLLNQTSDEPEEAGVS